MIKRKRYLKIASGSKGDTLIFRSDSSVNTFYVESAGISGTQEAEGGYSYEEYTIKCVQIKNADSDFVFRAAIQ